MSYDYGRVSPGIYMSSYLTILLRCVATLRVAIDTYWHVLLSMRAISRCHWVLRKAE